MYNPFMDLPKGNPNFNYIYKDEYKVDLGKCVQVTAVEEMVDRGFKFSEQLWVTELDVAEKQVNEVIEYFNATLRHGESPRRIINIKDIKTFDSAYGIIDREGNYYPCEFGGHDVLSQKLVKEKGLYNEYFKHLKDTKGCTYTDFLVNKKLWGLRHNPLAGGTPYLNCERPTEAMEKTDEEISFYFTHIKRN